MEQKILVIQNNQIYRSELVKEMKNEGFLSIFEDPNGAEAFKILKNESIALIVIDIDLSGVNGFLIVNRIKKTPTSATIPILVLSEKSGESAFQKHKESPTPAEGYLELPTSTKKIIKSIKKLLGLEVEEEEIIQSQPIEEESINNFDVNNLDFQGDIDLDNFENSLNFEIPIETEENPIDVSIDVSINNSSNNTFDISSDFDISIGDNLNNSDSLENNHEVFEDLSNSDSLFENTNTLESLEIEAQESFDLSKDDSIIDLSLPDFPSEKTDENSLNEDASPSLESVIPAELESIVEEKRIKIGELEKELLSFKNESEIFKEEIKTLKLSISENSLTKNDIEVKNKLINSLNIEINELKNRLLNENAKNIKHTEEVSIQENKMLSLQKEIVILKEELSKTHSSTEESHSSNREVLILKQTITKKEREIIEYKELYNSKQKELLDLQDKLNEFELALADKDDLFTKETNLLMAEKKSLILEKDTLKSKQDENQNLINTLNKEIESLKSKQDENQNVINTLNEEIKSLKSKQDENQNLINTLNIESENLKSKQDENKNLINTLNGEIESLKSEISAKSVDIEVLKTEKNGIESLYNQIYSQKHSLEQDKNTLIAEKNEFAKRLEDNLAQFKDIELQKEKLRQLLSAANSILEGLIQ